MSRIGKKIITIPENVTFEMNGPQISVKGPKGELSLNTHRKISVKKTDNILAVERHDDSKLSKSLHGLTRMLIANMITGVTDGYEKKLELKGVGFKASLEGNKLNMSLGFSHPVEVQAPDGINFQVQKNTITVSGIDKQMVGQVAANIRAFKKPEPYKGKGIRYVGELIIKKAGKAAKAAGA